MSVWMMHARVVTRLRPPCRLTTVDSDISANAAKAYAANERTLSGVLLGDLKPLIGVDDGDRTSAFITPVLPSGPNVMSSSKV